MIALLITALAAAGFTFVAGWWGVAIVALAAGAFFSRNDGRPWRVALGTMLGWVLLLLLDTMDGRLGRVTSAVSGSMKIPGAALLGVTLLLPGLMGWSAATVGAAIGQAAKSRWRGVPDVT
ncbi:hypothetical protein BH11GEM1_BH11GEM1_16730 [soil metagenome]